MSCPKIQKGNNKYIKWLQFTKGTRGKPNEQLFPRQVVIQLPKLKHNYVTHIIGEPKYKNGQQEQVTVRNQTKVPPWNGTSVFPCSLSSCFVIPSSIVITSFGEEGAGLVLLMHLFVCFVVWVFVIFPILLVLGVGCALWLWHSLDFSTDCFWNQLLDILMLNVDNKYFDRMVHQINPT